MIIVNEVPMAGKDILSAINDLLRGPQDEDGADRQFANKMLILYKDDRQTSPLVAGG